MVLTRLRNKLRFGHLRNNVILIYTMGKVGSSSIYESCKGAIDNVAVFHVHFLSDKWMDNVKDNQFQKSNINNAKFVRDYLDRNNPSKLKIATLTRDPIMVEVSGLFQNWERHFDQEPEEVPVEEILSVLEKRDFSYPLTWFDEEFRNFADLDIYDMPFNKERGYTVYKSPHMDVLVMKLESLNDHFDSAMLEWLDVAIPLKKSNVRSQKKNSQKYAEVKRRFKVSQSTLNLVYNSKMIKHFYTPMEIEEFKSRWS